jgi:rsbT co-antagonist protein RsbR
MALQMARAVGNEGYAPSTTQPLGGTPRGEPASHLLVELAEHLRRNRGQLHDEWARQIGEAKLIAAASRSRVLADAASVYDGYAEALEVGSAEALEAYARGLSERFIARGAEIHEVIGLVLLLRDVLARSLFDRYAGDFGRLSRILDAYEPAANRIAHAVALGLVQERERLIRQQQEAIRELLEVAAARESGALTGPVGQKPGPSDGAET